MKLPDPLQNVPEGTFPVTSDLYSDRDILCYIRHFFRDHHSNEKRDITSDIPYFETPITRDVFYDIQFAPHRFADNKIGTFLMTPPTEKISMSQKTSLLFLIKRSCIC